MSKMVGIYNIHAFVIYNIVTMRVLVNKLLKNALLSQFVANFIGFIANFNLFKIFLTKNIADMHREHNVLVFFKHRQKH